MINEFIEFMDQEEKAIDSLIHQTHEMLTNEKSCDDGASRYVTSLEAEYKSLVNMKRTLSEFKMRLIKKMMENLL